MSEEGEGIKLYHRKGAVLHGCFCNMVASPEHDKVTDPLGMNLIAKEYEKELAASRKMVDELVKGLKLAKVALRENSDQDYLDEIWKKIHLILARYQKS